VEIVLAQVISFFALLIIQMTPAFFIIIYGFDVSCCNTVDNVCIDLLVRGEFLQTREHVTL